MDPTNTGERIPSGGQAVAPPRGYALSGKIMLSAIVVLFSVVLFLLFLHVYARWYVLQRAASRRRRLRRHHLVFAAEGPAPAPPASLRGLDPEVLKSIPVSAFFSAPHDGVEESEVVECAVCLNEFKEGEKVRKLPPCRHSFHVDCIDMWFHSHASCPLCRSAVVAARSPSPPLSSNTVVVPISEEPPPPPASAQPRDPLASCLRMDEETSSSSRAAALSIEVPVRRAEGFMGGLEDEVGSPVSGFKSPGGSRIMSLKRLWSRDLRSYRGAEPDLERGERAERSPATPPTSSQYT